MPKSSEVMWTFCIPRDLAAKFDLLHPKHGSRKRWFIHVLRSYLEANTNPVAKAMMHQIDEVNRLKRLQNYIKRNVDSEMYAADVYSETNDEALERYYDAVSEEAWQEKIAALQAPFKQQKLKENKP